MTTIALTGISTTYSFDPSTGQPINEEIGTATLTTIVSQDQTFEFSAAGLGLVNATGSLFKTTLSGLNGQIVDSSDPFSIDPSLKSKADLFVMRWEEDGVQKSAVMVDFSTRVALPAGSAPAAPTPTGSSQLFVLGGDALPAFADVAAYTLWAESAEKDYAGLLATPFIPGTPFDLRDIPGASISEDDVISGLILPGYIIVGDGNDFVDGEFSEEISIIGGAGNDTLEGGKFEDFLMGNADHDRLVGRGGDDTMLGGTGNDTMNGNVGDDEMFGGSGNDRMRGGAGEDSLFGNSGDDTIDGGRNHDTVDGGGGNDLLAGDHGNDVMFGQSGNDTMAGGEGRDTLNGGAGDDVLTGDAGRDRLVGNSGDDTLIGGVDNDVLRGGAGADVFVFGFGHDQDRIVDFTDNVDRLDITSGRYATVSEMLDDATEIDGDVLLLTTGTSLGSNADWVLIENITIAQLTDDIDLTSNLF
ncbi:calcium-binding protein [Ascidiaceihabitans sp.]|uniref:calcium-binding protein n=1 Tax=Ascidiaceihabitans sp. TaxID=1872644 RepID=UPI003299E2F3